MRIINLHREEEELDRLLRVLRKADSEGREIALKEINKQCRTLADGIKILKYTKKDFPSSDFPWLDMPSRLIDIAVRKPYVGYIEVVKEIFDYVSFPAKVSILLFLSEYNHIKATEAYMELLRRIYLELRGLPIGTFASMPRHGDILFPDLLELTNNKALVKDIYYLLILYLDNGQTSDEAIRVIRPDIVKEILTVIGVLLEKNKAFRSKNMWDDEDYIYWREFADIHIILAAFIKDIRIINGLYKLMKLRDKVMKMYAITSLLGMDCKVESEDFLDVAKDDEARLSFYEALVSMGHEDRFPKEYKSNEDFSRSVMVDWLCTSREFSRPPDSIELVAIHEMGETLFYMFKFSSTGLDFEDKGEMVGMVGPYYFNEDPNILTPKNAYSQFQTYNRNRIKAHFDSLVEYL